MTAMLIKSAVVVMFTVFFNNGNPPQTESHIVQSTKTMTASDMCIKFAPMVSNAIERANPEVLAVKWDCFDVETDKQVTPEKLDL